MKPIRRLKAVRVFENKHGTLFNDEVVGPSGQEGRYLRWVWTRPGVAIIPLGGASIGFCRMYRYSPHIISLEIPRGGISPDEDVNSAAARELLEETGLVATSCATVGQLYADTGLIETPITVVVADVSGHDETLQASIEPMESIEKSVTWVNTKDMDSLIADGGLICSITLSAIALFMARRRG